MRLYCMWIITVSGNGIPGGQSLNHFLPGRVMKTVRVFHGDMVE